MGDRGVGEAVFEGKPRTVIFDLDETLYEDEAIFDVYAREMGKFVPAGRRAAYLADWEAAKAGHGVATIGLGYEEATDRLFRFADDRIIEYVDWSGVTVPTSGEGAGGPLFAEGRFNIGDWWWLPAAIAAHYGVGPAERGRAFLATRASMATGNYRLVPVAGVDTMLRRLRGSGIVLVAMTNSPRETTDDVLCQLGIAGHFDQIVPDAGKPAGLTAYLEGGGVARPVLSVGDNFVNDIAPSLRAGDDALYIDRHNTGLGEGNRRCVRVGSAEAMVAWMDRICGLR